MTVLVLLAFAAHVVAWLLLPDRTAAKTVREPVHAARALQASGI